MKIKALVLILFVLSFAQIAHAKEVSPSEKADANAVNVMPASYSPSMQRAEEIKKALDAATEEPSLSQKVQKGVESVVEAVKEMIKVEPQKGDPKTDFSQSENQMHSAKTTTGPNSQRKVDTTVWTSASSFQAGSNMIVTYSFDPSVKNPFNAVIVIYDIATGTPTAAIGYETSVLSAVPDLTGMNLTYTAVDSDGLLALQQYQSVPNTQGTITQVSLYYASGNVPPYLVVQSTVQPLDLKKTKLPPLTL